MSLRLVSKYAVLAGAVAGSSLGLAACADPPLNVTFDVQGKATHVEAKNWVMLGGKKITVETLKHGREVYTHFCRACHGDEGDGRGASSVGLRPPPRDFRQGMFKFGSVAGGLPTDDDFKRIITGGLKGTPMLPWDLADEDLEAVVQYIKTFSSRWTQPKWKQGDIVVPPADPWLTQNEADAIERGKFIYHQKAQCGSCHPNFATYAELNEYSKKDTGAELAGIRDDLYGAQLKESEYKVNADLDGKGGYKIKLLPPDFTRHNVRSVRMEQGKATALVDLYRVIGGGIAGTPMPTWRGVFPDEDIWAMAHYVYSLVAIRDTPLATVLSMKLMSQPKFVPPPPAPEPAPEPAPAPETSASAAVSASASAAPSAKPPAKVK
jgi:mono/diheme cytochrome c family protein